MAFLPSFWESLASSSRRWEVATHVVSRSPAFVSGCPEELLVGPDLSVALSRSVLGTRRQPLGDARKPSLLEEFDCLCGSGEIREVGFVLLTLGSRWRSAEPDAQLDVCACPERPRRNGRMELSLWTRRAPVCGGAGEAEWPRGITFLSLSGSVRPNLQVRVSSKQQRCPQAGPPRGVCVSHPIGGGVVAPAKPDPACHPDWRPGGFTLHAGLSSVVRSVIL